MMLHLIVFLLIVALIIWINYRNCAAPMPAGRWGPTAAPRDATAASSSFPAAPETGAAAGPAAAAAAAAGPAAAAISAAAALRVAGSNDD